MTENNIDFVILWVDGNDKEWLKEKNKYLNVKGDSSPNRFRDCENLQYLFRGIEKFAPWVNKIYFITWGHLPNWLDTSNEKLVIVRHEEFIPKEYLPTFNSNVIEMNLHRIKELSEKFVLFNDDLFILKRLKPTDFFVKDIPKDMYIEYVKKNCSNRHKAMRENYLQVINKYFTKKEFFKRNLFKVLNYTYGLNVLKTLSNLKSEEFGDFYSAHLTQSFKKSTFETIWEKENARINEACLNKFRANNDLGIAVCRYWQLLQGKFVPCKSLGKYFTMSNNNAKLVSAIRKRNYKVICVNDVDSSIDFDKAKQEINTAFSEVFPNKSQFEIQ